MLRAIRSWFFHRMGWNKGVPQMWRDDEGKTFIGFMCQDCLKIHTVRDISALIKAEAEAREKEAQGSEGDNY